jgi:hypothetical protein
VDERRKVIEDVDKDRRYAIDAAIVRIMKSRKVLGHQQLVMECVEQLGRMFKVSLSLSLNFFFFLIFCLCVDVTYDGAKTRSWKLFFKIIIIGIHQLYHEFWHASFLFYFNYNFFFFS